LADQAKLVGTLTVDPLSGQPSGSPSTDVPIEELLQLQRPGHVTQVDLDSDSPKVVSFGDLAQAELVYLRAFGGKVRARFTSADGTEQSVPFDPTLILFTSREPITALDLTRVTGAGTTVKVKVLLGEKV
jgi:hypothetical protein